MIVAKPKPFTEILEMVGDYPNILVAGCATCVAVCLAGGRKEASALADRLRLAIRAKNVDAHIEAQTVERQCDREFLRLLQPKVDSADAVISMACGAGIQFLAQMCPDVPVFPGVDTVSIAVADAAGSWTERCRSCNQCYLGLTGGICPVTMCAKGLLNGPCSGPINGRCEADPDKPCAWIRINERLGRQSRKEILEPVASPVRHSECERPAKMTRPEYRHRALKDAGSK